MGNMAATPKIPPTGTRTFFTRKPRRDISESVPRDSDSTMAARSSGSET